MPHESELDLNCHVSVAAKNHSKNVFKKGHVTIDPAQQQVCCLTARKVAARCANVSIQAAR